MMSCGQSISHAKVGICEYLLATQLTKANPIITKEICFLSYFTYETKLSF